MCSASTSFSFQLALPCTATTSKQPETIPVGASSSPHLRSRHGEAAVPHLSPPAHSTRATWLQIFECALSALPFCITTIHTAGWGGSSSLLAVRGWWCCWRYTCRSTTTSIARRSYSLACLGIRLPRVDIPRAGDTKTPIVSSNELL